MGKQPAALRHSRALSLSEKLLLPYAAALVTGPAAGSDKQRTDGSRGRGYNPQPRNSICVTPGIRGRLPFHLRRHPRVAPMTRDLTNAHAITQITHSAT